MSIITTKDVSCDVCGNWARGATGKWADRTIRTRVMMKCGWGAFRRDGVPLDVCPRCQTDDERNRISRRRKEFSTEPENTGTPIGEIKNWREI